jgi:AbrB family looped-hinge helix DNA binding protein
MKATGIVRRVDDLGRIIIPKDIRRQLRISEGEPMEFFLEKDTIILKKFVEESYTVRQGDDWVELVDPQGNVIAKGHTLRPAEVLEALGIVFKVEEIEDEF